MAIAEIAQNETVSANKTVPGFQDIAGASVRIFLGMVLLINSCQKLPLINHFADVITADAEGQPLWIQSYINWFSKIASSIGPPKIGITAMIVEFLLGISLLSGSLIRVSSLLGGIYFLLILMPLEAFGGVFAPDATDLGSAIGLSIALLLVFVYQPNKKLSFTKLDKISYQLLGKYPKIAAFLFRV